MNNVDNLKNYKETKTLENLNGINIYENENKNSLRNNNNQKKTYYHINGLNNIENINYIKVNNILTLNNQNNNKDFYIIENDLPKKLNNSIINKKKINNSKTNIFQSKEKKYILEKNTKVNNYIYNKKNIKSKTIKDSFKTNYSNNFLKKENEIAINFNEKKKNNTLNLLQKEEICKTEDIFIEKSPTKSHKNTPEKLNTHRKNLFSEQITRKYFTIINQNNKNKKEEKSISLNQKKKPMNFRKKNENVNTKIITKKNKIKHSKIPKRDPIANIQIDLSDLIKQDMVEKSKKIPKKLKNLEKKSKLFYDYPEDLKYDVFGKQHKFTYKDK